MLLRSENVIIWAINSIEILLKLFLENYLQII